ncbi:MAG TPA: antibiotic resistance protein VanZ [Sphaerochaeta sp.]|jgi:VanZ family protein|nr:antibiotic resistance protein VanZ [Sphaerochaeta sp.]HPZ16254.1 antibiotic resistance protein VanZ [Sphaerochaeta sp.]
MRGRVPLQRLIRRVGIVLTTIVVILILVFSFMPGESAPKVSWIPFADKGAHLLAYAALGFSSFLATLEIPGFTSRKKRRSDSNLHISSWAGRSIIISLVAGTILGALVELIQPTFGRSREWADLAADFMGLVVGLAVVLVLLKLLGSFFITRPWLYDPNWEEEVDESRREDSRRVDARSGGAG